MIFGIGDSTVNLYPFVRCSNCGQMYDPYTTFHACTPRPPGVQTGWICPVCGRGNAPWKSTCDCDPGRDGTGNAG